MLETLGAGQLFNETVDFSTLSEHKGILFDDAVHKAKIQIDEEGTNVVIDKIEIVMFVISSLQFLGFLHNYSLFYFITTVVVIVVLLLIESKLNKIIKEKLT